ncbi:MAG: hypothetical protein LBV41_00610 [Cytophagaceae bacterium]|jgi:hypothetical protein|nr:hypothetical protein [Cytophagaceae bacterium]
MARLMYQSDSTRQHRRMARRHIRLCGQIKGAAKYGQAMQPKLDTLTEKENEKLEAEELCENALDDLTLKNATLDNCIRNVYDIIRIYDRDNLTDFITVLFPNNRFTDITSLPVTEEPLEVVRLIEKLKNAEDQNFVLPHIDSLTAALNSVNEAIANRQHANENLSRRQANEELARNDIRAQYEFNYLDARKDLGKQRVELLFPKVARKGSKTKKDANNNITEE